MTLLDLFSKVLRVPAERIDDQTSPKTLAKWSSLKHMELVVAMEESFGVTLTPAEIQSIRSFSDARALLVTKGVAV